MVANHISACKILMVFLYLRAGTSLITGDNQYRIYTGDYYATSEVCSQIANVKNAIAGFNIYFCDK